MAAIKTEVVGITQDTASVKDAFFMCIRIDGVLSVYKMEPGEARFMIKKFGLKGERNPQHKMQINYDFE